MGRFMSDLRWRLHLRCTLGACQLALDLEASERVINLSGPSGSGKTSIVMMIAGHLRPDQGRISIDNKLLFDHESGISLCPQKRQAGILFQNLRLFAHMNVADNIRFAMAPGHRDYDRILNILKLRPLMGRKPDKLSGGESQRVALARTLLGPYRFLLLDEPLAFLDKEMRMNALEMIDDISRRDNTPVLFITHHESEARSLNARVVEMDG